MRYSRALSRHSTETAEEYNKNLSDTPSAPDKRQSGKFQKQIKLPFLKISSQIISRPSSMLKKAFCSLPKMLLANAGLTI